MKPITGYIPPYPFSAVGKWRDPSLRKDHQRDQLEQLPWDTYMDVHQTFLFKGNVRSRMFNNSIYAMQLAKDALVDAFRKKYNRRPSVGRDHADVHFVRCGSMREIRTVPGRFRRAALSTGLPPTYRQSALE
ncbi:MAG: hypothetical protein R2806_19085 [Saprospiraceae bacterium]